jgi:glycosyltransferase involved in cell wall biosynthesis
MKLSIITINWNNASGLKKTMESVINQSCQEFEYLIIDGGSTDGSVDVIKKFEGFPNLQWVSEKDNGIYNAMNKGIRLSKGDYIQFLNSGDSFVDKDVVKKILEEIENNGYPDILVGNLLEDYGTKRLRETHGNRNPDLWFFFSRSIHHNSSFMKRNLFEEYGVYDENLRISSDWKWFLYVVGIKKIKPVFVNVDVVLFNMEGVSVTNQDRLLNERMQVLNELVDPNLIDVFLRYGHHIKIMQQLEKHKWSNHIVMFLYKLSKWIYKRKPVAIKPTFR